MSFPSFDKQDEIPKGFESAYHEVDGKWVVKQPENKDAETLVKVRAEKKEAEKAAKAATDLAADLQRKLDAKDASGADTDKKVKELLEKWEKDKDAAVAAVAAERDKLAADLRDVKLYDKAKQAFIDAGGKAEKADAALKLKKELLDLSDDRIVVKNDKGEVTTEPIADFWGKSFKKEMPEFFAGTKAAGGGAQGGAGFKPASGDASSIEALLKNPLAALQKANEEGVAA